MDIGSQKSLLGSFYGKIDGSQEDIASGGLVYVLNRSRAASAAVTNLAAHECGIDLPTLVYSAQDVGDELERPDVSGRDNANVERLIIEAKFWAGLTFNQPLNYLKRLTAPGSVLLFVCPDMRVSSLWDELVRRLEEGGVKAKLDPQRKLAVLEKNQYLLIKTWKQLLGVVRESVLQDPDRMLVSDVDQIIGFCNTIDETSFLPIIDEEFSPAVGRRVYSYYLLMDKVIDELQKRKRAEVNLTGMKATGQFAGYTRYFMVGKLGLSLDLDLKNWFERADTPFWLGVQAAVSGGWQVTGEIRQGCKAVEASCRTKFHMIEEVPFFPLYPKFNAPEDVVLTHLCQDIENIITTVQSAVRA